MRWRGSKRRSPNGRPKCGQGARGSARQKFWSPCTRPRSDEAWRNVSAKDDDANETQKGAFVRALQRVVVIEPRELRSIAWSLLYFFNLLASAFVLRPLRDSMGLNGGPDKYPMLFPGTLVAMIAVSPLCALLVTKRPRRRFTPIHSRVSMPCLFAFWLWLKFSPGSLKLTAAYTFFVWFSVF